MGDQNAVKPSLPFVRIFTPAVKVDHPLDDDHQWNELYYCPKCGGLEASLMEYCPMERLTSEELNLVYQIYVNDCETFEPVTIAQYNRAARRYNDELLDGISRNGMLVGTGIYST